MDNENTEQKAQKVVGPAPLSSVGKPQATASTPRGNVVGGIAPVGSIVGRLDDTNRPRGTTAPQVQSGAPARQSAQPTPGIGEGAAAGGGLNAPVVNDVAQDAAFLAQQAQRNYADRAAAKVQDNLQQQIAMLQPKSADAAGGGGSQYMNPLCRPVSITPPLGFPWGEDHPWGLVSVAGAVVTIAAGEFEAGNGAALATTQTSFTISHDASWIGLKYAPSSGLLSVFNSDTAKPVSGGGVFQTWLYFFKMITVTPSTGAPYNVAAYVKHNLTGSWHAALFAATTA